MASEKPSLPCDRCSTILAEHETQLCRRCQIDPWPWDTWLRHKGWRIWERKNHKLAMWMKSRRLETVDTAISEEKDKLIENQIKEELL